MAERFDEAGVVADTLLERPPTDPNALGDEAGAMTLLRDAVARGWTPPGALHRDPFLEPLWGRPAFRELIRPNG